MSIEQDVADVNAVVAALSGPIKAWTLINASKNDIYVTVYSTEAIAREVWKRWVNSDCDNYNLPAESRDSYTNDIDAGINHISIGDTQEYTLECNEIDEFAKREK